MFEKHNELDQRIKDIEEGRERADSFELETLNFLFYFFGEFFE
ncbi:DUF465 domain-containing protein [Campylobacter hyointestinalis]|nr:hypothetical protein CDQ76_09180 [Campylobacter hyointestinalis subsp. hyointestinalis]